MARRLVPHVALFLLLQHRSVGAAVTPFDLMHCRAGAPALTTECMTREDYNAVREKVSAVLSGLNATCNEAACPQAEWAGCVLRMAGHDFMDFDGYNVGGSDGCTDMEDGDNAGLAQCLHKGEFGVSLKDVYQDFCLRLSLADFIVLAAEAVMAQTRYNQLQDSPTRAGVDFGRHFRYGRTTQRACPSAQGKLPNPERGCADVDEVFVKRMGLSWNLAAALMGVHTLGRARKENSGYDGWWMDPENSRRFNNQYYVAFVTAGWVPELAVGGNSGKNQWMRSDKGRDGGGGTLFPDFAQRQRRLAVPARHQMMLNTDLCLMYTNGREEEEVGEPVLAARDACCAWVEPERFLRAIQVNGNNYCGGSRVQGASHEEEERELCCGGDNAQDCGNFEVGNGPAFTSVMEFANDEVAWLYAFQLAWTKATENGFTELHRYRASCPAGGGGESMPASMRQANERARMASFSDKWAALGRGRFLFGSQDAPVALVGCATLASAAVMFGCVATRPSAVQRQGRSRRAVSRALHGEAYMAVEGED